MHKQRGKTQKKYRYFSKFQKKLGLFLALFLLASCSTTGTGSNTGSAPPPFPATPETTAQIAPCFANQLAVRLTSGDAGAGNMAANYTLTNTSEATCILKGYPAITFKDASGEALQSIRIVQTEQTYFHKIKAPETIALVSGGEASFQVAWTDMPANSQTACPTAAEIQINPPEDPEGLILATNDVICGDQVSVTPIQLGLIQEGS